MKFYFAPMEGITTYIYRNAHKKVFNNIDKYFSPFISPNQNGSFKAREINDLIPENNKDLFLVPQILTKNENDFIDTAKMLKQMGYNEINLNLGCPHGTVVSKNKGAGFLSRLEELDSFFDKIFSENLIKISVKTRIGVTKPDEFFEIIKVFNKYPIHELIIHPRIQKDFYKNKPNMNIFEEALGISKNTICYNGDIFTLNNYEEFTKKFTNVESIMIGRGLIKNPVFTNVLNNKVEFDKDTIQNFHDVIYKSYNDILFGDVPILHKMKSIWFYMINIFSNSEKYGKKIKKSSTLIEYNKIISELFKELQLIEKHDNL